MFVDGFLEIPLELGGGVLTVAQLDGKPARLSVPPAVVAPPRARNHSRRRTGNPPTGPFCFCNYPARGGIGSTWPCG